MVADLIKQSTDGRDSVYAGLKELRELGYIEHIEVREKGKIIGHEYLVYEDPQTPQTENPEVAVEPYPEKPDTANPDTKKPDRENPTLLINDLTNQSIRHHTEPNNKETVAAIQKQIESILEQSVSSLTKTLPNWIERFGMDRLIEVAQFIGNTRGKWDNPVGTYRTAITEEWDVSIVTQATEEVAASQDKRYKAFYELFPDS
jgi:hypothetical protein